jgi:hypothetical protein
LLHRVCADVACCGRSRRDGRGDHDGAVPAAALLRRARPDRSLDHVRVDDGDVRLHASRAGRTHA